jgi:Zn-dependent protease with chaperone function
MASPRKLTGLIPQAYEHPSDKAALDILAKTPGLDTLVRKLNEWGFEPLLRVQLTGSYLHVLPDHFPDLTELITAACETLDLPSVPDLYIAGSGELNAATAGVKRPLIYVTSAAVEVLTPEELLFVMAHEVGHVKSNHVLYYQIAEYFPVIAGILGDFTFNVGKLLSTPLEVALMRYKRMAEFTADRAGLLACQDVEVALRALMKLAGLPRKYHAAINTEDFMRQAREFQAMDSEKLKIAAKWLSVMGATHPWTVMRAQQLLQWIDSGGYATVLQNPRNTGLAPLAGAAVFCNQCGNHLRGGEAFCPACGNPIGHSTPGQRQRA